MVDEKYGVAYSEILEILKYIPIEDYNKIPKDKIEIFETYANKEYTFEYDPNKTLKEQNVSNITKRDYNTFYLEIVGQLKYKEIRL